MADIWGSVGKGDSGRLSEHWLYRKHGRLHGPLDEAGIVKLLLDGDLSVDDEVAREGGEDFHPVRLVKSFSSHMPKVAKAVAARRARRRRATIGTGFLLVLVGLAVAAYMLKRDFDRVAEDNAAKQKAAEERLAKENEERRALLAKSVAGVDLLGLVQVVPDKSTSKKRRPGPKSGKGKGLGPTGSDGVSGCQRSDNDIKGGLGRHVGKIKTCIADEKARSGSLPGTITMRFSIQAAGNVSGFGLVNRDLRTGPFANCMTKVFRSVRYPPTQGSSCSVNLPMNL